MAAAVMAIAVGTSAADQPGGPEGIGMAVAQACTDLPAAMSLLIDINANRAQGTDCGNAGRFASAAPLRWDDRLAGIAGRQAEASARRRELLHRIGTADLGSRLRAVTYEPAHASENLAVGPATIAGAVSRWVVSPPHCANLMAPHLADAGVGCAIGTDADGLPTWYWALVLGEPRPTASRDVQTVLGNR